MFRWSFVRCLTQTLRKNGSYTSRCWHKGTPESNIWTNTLLFSLSHTHTHICFVAVLADFPSLTTRHHHTQSSPTHREARLFLNTTLPHISSQRAPHGPLLSFNIQSPTCELFSVHTARCWSHTVLISPPVGRESEAMWLVWPGRVCLGVWDNVFRHKLRIKTFSIIFVVCPACLLSGFSCTSMYSPQPQSKSAHRPVICFQFLCFVLLMIL